jgi:hypothetical protein
MDAPIRRSERFRRPLDHGHDWGESLRRVRCSDLGRDEDERRLRDEDRFVVIPDPALSFDEFLGILGYLNGHGIRPSICPFDDRRGEEK